MTNKYKARENSIEAIEYIESHGFNFAEGNVIKYITRYKYKHYTIENKVKDLMKAKEYIDYIINNLKNTKVNNDLELIIP